MENRIQIVYKMNKLQLRVDTATPLGLIVNELLTNALKHAFPNNNSGIINIDLQPQSFNLLKLIVADDGIGSDKKINDKGFGTQLVELLSQQLNGTISTDYSSGGTLVIMEFKWENEC